MIRFNSAREKIVWLLRDAIEQDGGSEATELQVIPFKNPSKGFYVIDRKGLRYAVRVESLKRRPVPSKSH